VSPEAERLFTVSEANAALPGLRRRLERICAARAELIRSAEKVRGLERGGDAGHAEEVPGASALRRELEVLAHEGIVLRDTDAGSADFSSERGGERVFLCWTPEDPDVRYWHGPDSGFAGRRFL